MISLDISLNEKQFQLVRTVLGAFPEKAEKAIARAINRAVEGGRTDAVKAVCEEYEIKPSKVRQSINIVRANPQKLQAQIISTGRPLPLIQFKVNPKSTRTKRRVIAGVKFGNAIEMPHAFIQKMSNGHVGVFERAKFGGKLVGRMPIEQKYAPSFPQMLGNDEVLKYIEMKAHYRLDKELRHQVTYLLGGG
jgi:hypothetical protein